MVFKVQENACINTQQDAKVFDFICRARQGEREELSNKLNFRV